MKRRERISIERDAWRRAKGHCEECGLNLVEKHTVQVPAKRTEYFIQLWSQHPCWRCNLIGRIVQIVERGEIGHSYLDPSEPDARELGEIVRKRYPFFRPGYSYTMEMTYYANHCESCKALQGDHLLKEWLMITGLWETPDLMEPIPEFVDCEPGHSDIERNFLPYKIHRRNWDKSDCRLDNLQLLCEPCYRVKRAASRAAKAAQAKGNGSATHVQDA